jgi:uncharacterized phiE125 gp8 family phage protein
MLRVTVPPEDLAVTVAEAKTHLRVDDDVTDDDALIETYVRAAIDSLDGPGGWLGRALMPQTLELRLDTFPAGGVRLPCPPLIAVTGVAYLDGSDVLQTLSASTYQVLGAGGERPARIALAPGAAWPATSQAAEAVRITYQAGHLDTASPPEGRLPYAIKAALLLMIGDLYAVRESVVVGAPVARSPTVEALLHPKRVPYLV